MKKLKSVGFTALIGIGIVSGLYFIPLQIGQKPELAQVIGSEEEQFLGEDATRDSVLVDKVEVPEIVIPKEEKSIVEEKTVAQPVVAEPKKELAQKESETKAKKEEQKKPSEKPEEKPLVKEEQKTSQKESKIGVDRKLVAGIPGTMKYKGKFPPHNVKEKGSITISYEVDAAGNVVSAYRLDGLRDKNTINNAISMVKKYVKAEKSNGKSKGTYTLSF